MEYYYDEYKKKWMLPDDQYCYSLHPLSEAERESKIKDLENADKNNKFIIINNSYGRYCQGISSNKIYYDITDFAFFVDRSHNDGNFETVKYLDSLTYSLKQQDNNFTEPFMYIHYTDKYCSSNIWQPISQIINLKKLVADEALVPNYSNVVNYVEHICVNLDHWLDPVKEEQQMTEQMKRAYDSLPMAGKLIYEEEGNYSF